MKQQNLRISSEARLLIHDLPEPTPVLLVDDREENLLALEAVLRNPGYNLVKVQSGDDALRFLLENIPALILMDVQMPGLDGYETAAIIKSNPRTREIPIIFITAINTDEGFVHRGYEHGAIDYIYKPFDSHVLRSKVAVLVELHRKTERLVAAEKALRESESRDRERKIAELELKSIRREQIEQKRYRNLVEGIDHGIVWAASPDPLVVTYVSPTVMKLTGFTAEQWLEDPSLFLHQVDENDRAAFLSAVEQAKMTGTEVSLDHRIRKADGQVGWFHTGMRVSSKAEGNSLELRGLSVDITPLKNAEQTISQAKRRSDILAQTSLLLAESIDCAPALRSLAGYLQGRLADLCVIESLELGERCFALASGSTGLDENLRLAFTENPPEISQEDRYSFSFGASKVWHPLSPENLTRLCGNGQRAQALEKRELRSAIQVGLASRGKFLGTLILGFEKEDGASEANVALAEDIAYRISSALENSSLFQKAESAVRLRDEFLSIASHELRTPLTPLKIRVQQIQRLLSNGDVAHLPIEQLGKAVQNCNMQIERLTKLIDDLLDISRISQGTLSLRPEVFDLSELIRDIVSRFSGQLEASGCTVSLDLSSPLEVTLDPARVEQVLVNLLTNAIKYAPRKPIEIAASIKGEEVQISFRDHGIGIAPEDQARIFQRFERAVSSSHFGGLGLGLYIVSQILSAHGGRISVQSKVGQGAMFEVFLPVRLSNESKGILPPENEVGAG